MPIATGQTVEAAHITGLVNTQTSGTSVVVTTVAGERLIVWAKGEFTGAGSDTTINLRYDGSAKDTVTLKPNDSGDKHSFALMYSEVPGAQTSKTIDVTNSAGTVSNLKIVVMKVSTG